MYSLPRTGLAILTIGGASLTYPVIAGIGAGIVLAGFALMRLARPARIDR
jgi:hypothetical protein